MSNVETKNKTPELISRILPPKEIEYEDNWFHIVLCPYEPSDIQFFEKVLKENLPRLKKFMVWPHQDWTHTKCLEWLTKTHAEYFGGTCFEWKCRDKNSGEFILSAGIMPATPMNPDCWEIGYWTSLKHINKGLSTLDNLKKGADLVVDGLQSIDAITETILLEINNRYSVEFSDRQHECKY